MPNYTFKNINTNEIESHAMKISELDDFKVNNPHLERCYLPDGAPVLGDGSRMSTPGTGKPDSTFEKYVIGRMKESIPGNTMGGHKTKTPREW